jgi:lipid II:glycine glycyltransferase (peptidoglycan interpeptide bridge formation enzyme)
MYEGSAPDALGGATKLMHWEAMRFFKSLGVGRYDFCGARVDPEKGSKQETLAMFKRQMGGLFERGYLWKYVLRPIRGSVYSWAIRWKRGGDLVDQEGHKLNSSSQETAR